MWIKDERVRMMGIDTPESRTRDKVEKKFGLASKERLKSMLGKKGVLKRLERLSNKFTADANGNINLCPNPE